MVEDPLAFDYLSQQVGYQLFGSLTTRTSRAQYVAVVLYGLWLVETSAQDRALGADDEERKRLFERWERLWALAVHEYRGGQFERSDEDTIRGQRGVARAWRPGSDTLPLDYKLIGRQSELGSLGAYLSALRSDDASLVLAGSMRPTPLALPIIEAFWAEPGSGARVGAYEQFARLALDPDQKKIPRKHGLVTLAKLGELSRLSALTHCQRSEQRGRLWHALFERAKDDTLRFAEMVRAAHRRDLHDPRLVLVEALEGRLGTFSPGQRDKLSMAVAFGDVQRSLLTCFNRAYAAAFDHGWRVDLGTAASETFHSPHGTAVRTACARLLDQPLSVWFGTLPMHGREFLQLATTLQSASAEEALEALVVYHAAIHRERRHATPWFRIDGGRLVIDVGAYGARSRAKGAFPGLKLHVVRSLLADLARLS